MKLSEAYQSLTEEAKKQALRQIHALCNSEGVRVSEAYLGSVVRGCREHPCSAQMARIISAHFTGYIGINVSVQDVLDSHTPKPALATAA